jgi:hypothetical protein
MCLSRTLFGHWFFVACAFSIGDVAYSDDLGSLAKAIQPWFNVLNGSADKFRINLDAELKIDGKPQSLQGYFVYYGVDAFDLQLQHPDYSIELRRRKDGTALALPKHQRVFLGHGPTDEVDHLQTNGMMERLLSSGSQLGLAKQVPWKDPAAAILLMTAALGSAPHQSEGAWHFGEHVKVTFEEKGLTIQASANRLRLSFDEPSPIPSYDQWPGMQLTELSRQELERTLCRGCRRTLEILSPSASLQNPRQKDKKTAHGHLQWIEGARVVTLNGSPSEIGMAHGELLYDESWRCIDSVLHAFGLVKTIESGRWFREDLEVAYAQLAPHIPERHKVETRALAASLKCEPHLMECLSVFPELFHCSGFAVFGSATKDGKLYHGRVLDYMTTIGLQDAATTFIVSPQDFFPFANVGYAAFTGSVSGMNTEGISLGEMGGRGEGNWNGVPMATLMRRALEECQTLDQVMELWRSSPRTCEYYYVFADGKSNRAVGVAATPEKIEFVHPGEGHSLLGEGIRDSVVLSAGERLNCLRSRIEERHGALDSESARWLMSRPVAMNSNLHNVLFVPGDRVFYFANADHRRPAADCSYVKIDLMEEVRRSRSENAAR